MHYQVKAAEMIDLPQIEEIYTYARSFMAANGNPTQWGTSEPRTETLVKDIQEGKLFIILSEDKICGVFYFWIGQDPTYGYIEKGSWHSNLPYGTIHRITGNGSGGILKTAVSYCRSKTDYIRIDTHRNNHIMQRALEKAGFRKCGIIYIADGSERIAYDWMA